MPVLRRGVAERAGRDAGSLTPSTPIRHTPPAATDPPRFVPGTILAGRYRLVALLGKGGMGEVFRADDLSLDQTVALKFLPEGLVRNGPMLERFHREVRIGRRVSHQHVCRIHDIGDVDGRQFISMEYIDGEDLGFAASPHRTPAG